MWGGETATCDIRVNRKDPTKPTILFENKNYMRSVDSEEIQKFERDIMLQKKHGIFLSQSSPITFKGNFQIDVKNGLIMVYVPNAGNSEEKIKTAIDIVDALSEYIGTKNDEKKSESNSKCETNLVTDKDLEEIIKEYVEFGEKKMRMIETVREMSNRLMEQVEEIKMPVLCQFIKGTGKYENKNENVETKLVCEFCKSYTGKNKSSLAAHKRNCQHNPGRIKKSSQNTDIEIKYIELTF